MTGFEKIQKIKDDVLTVVQARFKKGNLNQRVDEAAVRRQIESGLESVVREQLDGHIEDSIRRYIIEEVVNAIFGLGPIDRLIRDPGVWEIMVNGPKEVYIEREGQVEKTDVVFNDEEEVHFYIERILSPSGRRVTEFEPYIDARLPDGSRLNVVRRPVAPFGPILTIRKANRKILGVQDLIERHTLDSVAAQFLKACVHNHLNIVIVGGPGSGKTTILNILSSYIAEVERVITIEDTMELRLVSKHCVALETRPASIEGKGSISMRDLVRNALHMRPDRLIIGEVRGEEALDMLQCMNIGRSGSMTTLHANSALDALLRMETMAMMGTANVSTELVRRQIVSAIDLVVMVDRLIDGSRRVVTISEVMKQKPEEYEIRDIFALTMVNEPQGQVLALKPTGHKPMFVSHMLNKEFFPEEFRG